MASASTRDFAGALGLGGLVVAAGSAAGVWLPGGMALLLGALALCRVLWLEDNIHSDLLRAERIPAGYRAIRSRRRHVLGCADVATKNDDCPRLLASSLRAQGHALSAFGWALAAAMLLSSGTGASVVFGLLTFALALRSADYFALSEAIIAGGRPLPMRLLAGRGPLGRLAMSTRLSD